MSARDEFDRMMDTALATYGDPGPDSGIEQRVINRVLAGKKHFNRRYRISWIVVPVAACALVFIFVMSRAPHDQSTYPPHTHAPVRPAVTSGDLPQTLPQLFRSKRRDSVASNMPLTKTISAAYLSARPKLDVFPTPTPLTNEEKALFVAPATESQPARHALVEAKVHQDDPLMIAELAISPLETPDEGNK